MKWRKAFHSQLALTKKKYMHCAIWHPNTESNKVFSTLKDGTGNVFPL